MDLPSPAWTGRTVATIDRIGIAAGRTVPIDRSGGIAPIGPSARTVPTVLNARRGPIGRTVPTARTVRSVRTVRSALNGQ